MTNNKPPESKSLKTKSILKVEDLNSFDDDCKNKSSLLSTNKSLFIVDPDELPAEMLGNTEKSGDSKTRLKGSLKSKSASLTSQMYGNFIQDNLEDSEDNQGESKHEGNIFLNSKLKSKSLQEISELDNYEFGSIDKEESDFGDKFDINLKKDKNSNINSVLQYDKFDDEELKNFELQNKIENKKQRGRNAKKMSRPFNPLFHLKKGSEKDPLFGKKTRKISGYRFNTRRASFERGESAGAQLHLSKKNVERNTRDTTNRVLNTVMELTPKSSLEQQDAHKYSQESDVSQSSDCRANDNKDLEANHYINQSFDNNKKSMSQVLFFDYKNIRNSKSIDFSKNVQQIRSLRQNRNVSNRNKLFELNQEHILKKTTSTRSNSKDHSFSIWEENDNTEVDTDKLFEELDKMQVPFQKQDFLEPQPKREFDYTDHFKKLKNIIESQSFSDEEFSIFKEKINSNVNLYLRLIMDEKQTSKFPELIRQEIRLNLDQSIETNFFNSLLEAFEHEGYLLDQCKSEKTFSIVIQVIDLLLKNSTYIKDGFYKIKLCSEEYVTYCNSNQDNENVITMIDNVQCFRQPFFHPSNILDQQFEGMFNKFQVKSQNDSSYNIQQQINQNQISTGICKQGFQNVMFFAQKPKSDNFFIEQFYDGYQIIVNRFSDELNSHIKERINNYQILAFNIETNTFESVKLEVVLVKEFQKYLFLFNFESIPELDLENTFMNNKENFEQSKNNFQELNLKNWNKLMNIYKKILSQGIEMFKDYQSNVVYRRFVEFMSQKYNSVVNNEFQKLLSDSNYINLITNHQSCSRIYQTLIHRKYYQQLWTSENAHPSFIEVNDIGCNKFLLFIYDRLNHQSESRNESIIIESIVKCIDQSYIQNSFVKQVLNNFDLFWKTNQGSEVFQIVYKSICFTTMINVLFKSIESKLIQLSCSRTESFIIEKLIRESADEIKFKIVEFVCKKFDNYKNDPVYIFIGDSKANFVIQTIQKCTLENQSDMNLNQIMPQQKNIILDKISFYQENYYSNQQKTLEFHLKVEELKNKEGKELKLDELKYAERIYMKYCKNKQFNTNKNNFRNNKPNKNNVYNFNNNNFNNHINSNNNFNNHINSNNNNFNNHINSNNFESNNFNEHNFNPNNQYKTNNYQDGYNDIN